MNRSPETRPSLLLRIRDSRDEQAWGEFVEIYEPLVYRLARRNGLQDADAHELTQEVLVAVAGAIDRWDPDPGKGSFRGWLFRIARNLMINFLAKQRRHALAVGATDFQRLIDEQPAPESDESSYFDQEYRRRLFRWAAEHVRESFQEKTWLAFWRTCVEGEPIADVAAALEMSAGSVYVARSRVMTKLKQRIERIERDDT